MPLADCAPAPIPPNIQLMYPNTFGKNRQGARQHIAHSIDFSFPVRELAPARKGFNRTPHMPSPLTFIGFFSYAIWRGLLYGSPYLDAAAELGFLPRKLIFESMADWLLFTDSIRTQATSTTDAGRDAHLELSLSNMAAFGTAIAARCVGNVGGGRFEKKKGSGILEERVWPDWSSIATNWVEFASTFTPPNPISLVPSSPSPTIGPTSPSATKVPFQKAYEWLKKAELRGFGDLVLLLFIGDLVYGGAVEHPTVIEFGTLVWTANKGARNRLEAIGLVKTKSTNNTDGTENSASTKDEFLSTFSEMYLEVRRQLQERATPIDFARMAFDVIVFEHSLCKWGRLEKKG